MANKKFEISSFLGGIAAVIAILGAVWFIFNYQTNSSNRISITEVKMPFSEDEDGLKFSFAFGNSGPDDIKDANFYVFMPSKSSEKVFYFEFEDVNIPSGGRYVQTSVLFPTDGNYEPFDIKRRNLCIEMDGKLPFTKQILLLEEDGNELPMRFPGIAIISNGQFNIKKEEAGFSIENCLSLFENTNMVARM